MVDFLIVKTFVPRVYNSDILKYMFITKTTFCVLLAILPTSQDFHRFGEIEVPLAIKQIAIADYIQIQSLAFCIGNYSSMPPSITKIRADNFLCWN